MAAVDRGLNNPRGKTNDVDFTIPLQRQWHFAHGPSAGDSIQADSTDDNGMGRDFSMVSYNILADCFLMHVDNITPHCPRECYHDTQRFPQLMRELNHHSADIVCLQEVGVELYQNHIEPTLRLKGYKGTLAKYTSFEAGCATFYKETAFELVEEQALNLSELLTVESQTYDTKGLEKMAQDRSFRIVLFSRLRCRHSNKILSVGNLHLSFGSYKKMDITALEGILAIRHLLRFAGGADQPHILCGDFNQEPHLPGYQNLHDGSLSEFNKKYLRRFPEADPEWKTKYEPIVDSVPYLFSHESKHLQSAFKTIVGHEPPFTEHEDDYGTGKYPSMDDISDLQKEHPSLLGWSETKPPRRMYRTKPNNYGTEVFIATLDYFWFGSDQLGCTQVLGMVDDNKILPLVSCPNRVFPSDHMLMAAHFRFSPVFPKA